MKILRLRGLIAPSILGVSLIACSCSSRAQYGMVEGVVSVNGQPAAGLRLEFHPDSDKGTSGPTSFADTDAEGKYRLQYAPMEKSNSGTLEGAAVGWHRVTVLDVKASRFGGGPNSPPARIPNEYMSLQTTPLIREVHTGTQTLNISIP